MSGQEQQKPIAYCQADDVEAWGFPFFVRPATDMESAFLFLEDHLYNLESDLQGVLKGMIRIESEDDLKENGYFQDEKGVFQI